MTADQASAERVLVALNRCYRQAGRARVYLAGDDGTGTHIYVGTDTREEASTGE